jgi:hypothetical protein
MLNCFSRIAPNKQPIRCVFASLREIVIAVFSIVLVSCGGHDTENAEYLNVDSLYLIPNPVFVEKREGSFKIDSETILTYSEDLFNEGLLSESFN